MMGSRFGLALVGVVGALVMAACGGHASTTTKGDATRASSPSVSVSPTTSPKVAAVRLPKGSRWLRVANGHLRFAVPASWTQVNPQRLMSELKSTGEIKRVSQATNISPQVLSEFAKAHVTMAVGPAANVNIRPTDYEEIPTVALMRSQLATANITIQSSGSVSTALGRGVVVRSKLPVFNGRQLYSSLLVVKARTVVDALTFTGTTRASTDALVATAERTVTAIS
jgi:hypothetical protein